MSLAVPGVMVAVALRSQSAVRSVWCAAVVVDAWLPSVYAWEPLSGTQLGNVTLTLMALIVVLCMAALRRPKR